MSWLLTLPFVVLAATLVSISNVQFSGWIILLLGLLICVILRHDRKRYSPIAATICFALAVAPWTVGLLMSSSIVSRSLALWGPDPKTQPRHEVGRIVYDLLSTQETMGHCTALLLLGIALVLALRAFAWVPPRQRPIGCAVALLFSVPQMLVVWGLIFAGVSWSARLVMLSLVGFFILVFAGGGASRKDPRARQTSHALIAIGAYSLAYVATILAAVNSVRISTISSTWTEWLTYDITPLDKIHFIWPLALGASAFQVLGLASFAYLRSRPRFSRLVPAVSTLCVAALLATFDIWIPNRIAPSLPRVVEQDWTATDDFLPMTLGTEIDIDRDEPILISTFGVRFQNGQTFPVQSSTATTLFRQEPSPIPIALDGRAKAEDLHDVMLMLLEAGHREVRFFGIPPRADFGTILVEWVKVEPFLALLDSERRSVAISIETQAEQEAAEGRINWIATVDAQGRAPIVARPGGEEPVWSKHNGHGALVNFHREANALVVINAFLVLSQVGFVPVLGETVTHEPPRPVEPRFGIICGRAFGDETPCSLPPAYTFESSPL